MKYSNLKEEKELWRKGYQYVVGLDEAGRGPLAGPVVAAAVFVIPNTKYQIPKLRDSKKISAVQRENFYEKLTNHQHITWGIGIISEKIIDKINILEATKLAMQKALQNLKNNQLSKVSDRYIYGRGEWRADFLILDGNFKLPLSVLQKSIIKADERVFSCTAAGIIAKVTRDKIMQKMHKKYPQYGFHRHKGYGTKLHVKKLNEFGPCLIHRKTFWPVKDVAKT